MAILPFNIHSLVQKLEEKQVVREADEVMEEEIVEDSDKEGDEIWSLTAIIQLGRLKEYHRDWGANVCDI